MSGLSLQFLDFCEKHFLVFSVEEDHISGYTKYKVSRLEDEKKCIVFTHPQANQSEDIYGVMIDHLVTTKHMKNDSFWS